VQGNVDRAARNSAALQRALAATPDDAYLHYQLGATQQAVGAHADACASLTHALALGGLSVEVTANAWMKLAQLALAAQDDATAVDAAERCLALRADDVVALQVLGLAAFGLGQLAVARTALTRLLAAPALAPSHRADIARLVGALPR
jgi:cytochrome c-type biogenesis protein CcmH/NrfG